MSAADEIEKLSELKKKGDITEEEFQKGKESILKTQVSKKGEDMKGKFGRILGDFVASDGRMVTAIMAEEGHCVPYFGGSKEDVQAQHMKNRERLIAEGKVKLK